MTSRKILWGGLILTSALVLSACNKYGGTSTSQSQTESPAFSGVEQTGNVITFGDAGFSPNQITVKVGDKIDFKNVSSSTVQVQSAPHPTHELFGELNIGAIAPGETKTVTFTTAGTKKYHNHLSPSQTGQIIVQ